MLINVIYSTVYYEDESKGLRHLIHRRVTRFYKIINVSSHIRIL